MFLILGIELLGKDPCIVDYISSLIFKIAALTDLILITVFILHIYLNSLIS